LNENYKNTGEFSYYTQLWCTGNDAEAGDMAADGDDGGDADFINLKSMLIAGLDQDELSNSKNKSATSNSKKMKTIIRNGVAVRVPIAGNEHDSAAAERAARDDPAPFGEMGV
jgi:hypothetical protein